MTNLKQVCCAFHRNFFCIILIKVNKAIELLSEIQSTKNQWLPQLLSLVKFRQKNQNQIPFKKITRKKKAVSQNPLRKYTKRMSIYFLTVNTEHINFFAIPSNRYLGTHII